MTGSAGFHDLPPELRNQCYQLVLREQPESRATVTVYPATETYQFSVPVEYRGFLATNKLFNHELKDLAARIYTIDDFEADKKKNRRELQVKTIIIDQRNIDVCAPMAWRFSLLPNIWMSDLLRLSILSSHLRRIELNVKFVDNGSDFIGRFTYSWDDEVAYMDSSGIGVWTEARSELEKSVRHVVYKPALCDDQRGKSCLRGTWRCNCRQWPRNATASVGSDTTVAFIQPCLVIRKQQWELVSHLPLRRAAPIGNEDKEEDARQRRTCKAVHLHRDTDLRLPFEARLRF